MTYIVLFKDDFGDKHIATFSDYRDAHHFYTTPSNVIFPFHLLNVDELWRYVTTEYHK